MRTRFQNLVPLAAMCAVLSVLVFAAGCDSDDLDPPDDDEEEELGPNETLYDTTGTTIRVYERGDDPEGTGTVTWTSDYTYVLVGRVAVNSGDVLTIEPGTVIKGAAEYPEGEDYPSGDIPQEKASVLLVARGAQIDAEGTADEPIIFTAESDDVSDPNDLTATTRGLWGGVIILGSAPLNTSTEQAIEGIPPEQDPRGTYGGSDADDDSGTFRYVSIRHGGTKIADDNEINGLTLGGVGRGTEIDHVEIFANLDDGIEPFGGTVDLKHIAVAFCGDDSFDIDQGYSGRAQFYFAVQATDDAGNTAEHDGGTEPETGQPYATPHVYNATYIGSSATDALAIYMRDNFAGSYYNSIFADFPGKAIEIEDLASGGDSRVRFEEDLLRIENNLFYRFGAGDTFDALIRLTQDDSGNFIDETFRGALADYLDDTNVIVSASPVQVIGREGGGLNPLPANAALTADMHDVLDTDSDFIEDVDYLGAFGDENWALGWTALDEYGIFAP